MIIVNNAEIWHYSGTLLLNINLHMIYFLTKALKIEGISVQYFLVISHFNSTVLSVMSHKSIFVTNLSLLYSWKYKAEP